jgi:hypothetical protein
MNCSIPINDSVARVKQISIHRQLYRTSGIYDIIVNLNSNTDNILRETMTQDIDGMDNINPTMTLRITDDKKGDIYSALILEIYKLGN